MKEAMEILFTVARGVKKPENKRMEIYRELVYNRFEDFIKTSFPLFFSFVEQEIEPLVRKFVEMDHTSPLLIDIGREFVEFFRSIETSLKHRLPFLEDLLIYEWAEIEVFNALDEEITPGFSWEGRYRLSRSSRLIHLNYPAHSIDGLSQRDILERKGSYYILLYRDPTTEVKRVELTAFVYDFLREVDSGRSPMSALENSSLGEEKEEVKWYLERFLKELLNFGILVEG